MSKPKRSSVTCSCGTTFDADVYKSVNVSAEPGLKETILAGHFNVVRCPSCERDLAADVPFLYHDADASRMVWVYPTSSAGQAEQIQTSCAARERCSAPSCPPPRSMPTAKLSLASTS